MKDRDFEKLKPNDLVEIEVPQILRVEKRSIEGDMDSSNLSEITLENEHLDHYEREILLKGGRVFYTENDMPLIIHSEKSLEFKEAIMSRVGR